MALNVERSGIRFAVKTVEGKPFVQLDLFHNTIPSLNELSIGFELLGGVTLEQARTLVDAMNERIVGVVVAPKWPKGSSGDLWIKHTGAFDDPTLTSVSWNTGAV
jgi:hypothetical protein